MRAVKLIAALLCMSAAVMGCKQPKVPPVPQALAATPRPAAEIAWFEGEVAAAFDKAGAENKPVFLYWGAEWCPYCKDLKANVFARRDFIEKSRLFVPVYLDGDQAGAQKWGEEFGVTGYPTVIVLRSDRTELARIGGGMDRNQYAEVLDLVLNDTKPVNELLAAVESSDAALTADDCRRLAFNAWSLDGAATDDAPRFAGRLQKAIQLCPQDARLERARLTAIAASAAAQEPGSALFNQLLQSVQSILADRVLAGAAADALQYLDEEFFVGAHKADPGSTAQLLKNWNDVMDTLAGDERYTAGTRLAAVRSKLIAAKALAPDGKIPPAQAEDAKRRVDAALLQKHDEYSRAGVVNAALNTLNDLGDLRRAQQVAETEMKASKTPYYYMSDLGAIAEELGRKDEAIAWFERAYRESKGTATRFQWGTGYVSALIRLAPEDEPRIQKAALEVLGELDGPDRLYRRTRARLDKLEANLRKWNEKGAHAATVAAIRGRMDALCMKIPEADAARGACEKFLAKA